ncbi:hypothetical protein B0H15DRAFT_953141 [Mycena belliarum]|uniref:Uncharacterized protein n=1 Tax=Mycena belliarum TaxID=1033014 RepID=A0AAD6XMY2_9AGAR|nr:hypothetical protein B0H15DRAFT_953141 [Mycena belliae]
MALPAFSFATTADEVAEALASEIQGKNVLITGTSLNGIGFEAARVLARHANLVIITGHDADRLKLAEDAILRDVPSANIRPLLLDLSSLDAVRKAAGEVNVYPEPLDVLIHNAAAPHCAFKLTVDGLETQMATDHIGPFLLTKLLAPKLLASAAAAVAASVSPSFNFVPRVVFVSSQGHTYGTGVDLSALVRPNAEKYRSFDAYFQAKSANALSAIALSRRSGGRINAYSLHPGAIYTNMYTKKESLPDMQAFGGFRAGIQVLLAQLTRRAGILGPNGEPTDNFKWKTIPQGAATILVAAFDPRLNDKPGAYLVNCNEANEERAPHSSDPAVAEDLWRVTEEIIGEQFAF